MTDPSEAIEKIKDGLNDLSEIIKTISENVEKINGQLINKKLDDNYFLQSIKSTIENRLSKG